MRMLMQKNAASACPEEKGTCPPLVNKLQSKSSPMIKPTAYRARPPSKTLLKVVDSAVSIPLCFQVCRILARVTVRRPTARVSGGGTSVNSAWGQDSFWVQKRLEGVQNPRRPLHAVLGVFHLR